jgi:DNA-binding GntR family transcriptional regulator
MPATAVAPSPSPSVLDGDIYERIVSAILDHKLPPGTKLVEDRLATAFGVSRTRIRPVLVRLANEQIVTLTPNRGASVAQPTEQEAREVFEVRRIIEPPLVRRFIEVAKPADLQRLADCISAEERARAAGDMRRAIRQSGDFHLHIAQGADHPTLGRILSELVSRTSLVLMTYSAAHAREREEATACGCREHRALFDAIRLRDAREAAQLMEEHLAHLEARLEFAPSQEEILDLVAVFS